MKASALLIGALAALANAVQFTDSSWDVVAGQPFTITWTGAVGDVTIKLKNGNSGNLKDVQTLTTSGTGGSFVWTPSSSLPSDTYALEITDSTGTPNYSSQFPFVGSGTPSATTSTASSTSASTSATTTSAPITTMSASNSTTTATTRTPLSNSTTLTTSTSHSTSATTTGSSSSSPSATSTRVPNTNDGHRLASSLALILGAVAAFAAFN